MIWGNDFVYWKWHSIGVYGMEFEDGSLLIVAHVYDEKRSPPAYFPSLKCLVALLPAFLDLDVLKVSRYAVGQSDRRLKVSDDLPDRSFLTRLQSLLTA